jgi:hypothetical protein
MLHPRTHGLQLPKNTNTQQVLNHQTSNIREVSTTPTTATTPPIPTLALSVLLLLLPKLSYAHQIQVLEAKMSNEERSLYLDACNMGEDFCSAGL